MCVPAEVLAKELVASQRDRRVRLIDVRTRPIAVDADGKNAAHFHWLQELAALVVMSKLLTTLRRRRCCAANAVVELVSGGR